MGNYSYNHDYDSFDGETNYKENPQNERGPQGNRTTNHQRYYNDESYGNKEGMNESSFGQNQQRRNFVRRPYNNRYGGGYQGGYQNGYQGGNQGGYQGGYQDGYNRNGYQGGYQNGYQRNGYQGGHNRNGYQGGYQRNYNDRPYNPNYRQHNQGGYQRNDYRDNNYDGRDDNRQFRPRRNYGQDGYRDYNYNRRPQGDFNGRYNDNFNRPDRNYNNSNRNQKRDPFKLLNVISRFNYGSPRICLEAIRKGQVSVNRNVVVNPYARVNMRYDRFEVNGVPVEYNLGRMYFAVNKTNNISGSYENDTPSVLRTIRKKEGWFAPYGCLDIANGGIVIYTNDLSCKQNGGKEIQNILKTYRVKVHRPIDETEDEINEIFDFMNDKTEDDSLVVELEKNNTKTSWLIIKSRILTPKEVRVYLKEFGLETISFERTAIGQITTSQLNPGSWRRLSEDEVRSLYEDSKC